MNIYHSRALHRIVFPAWIVLILTISLGLSVLKEPPCTVDEPAWITSGAVTLDLVARSAAPSEWTGAYDRVQLGDWGHKNPPIGKFYIGLGLGLTGHRAIVPYRWIWPQSYAENLSAGVLPPVPVLTTARLMIVLSAGVVLGLAYVTSAQILGSPWAVLAPLMLFALPVFRFHATHVYTDMPQLALMLASGSILIAYTKRQTGARIIAAAVLAGLACAVKFNAAPAVLSLVVVTLLARRWRDALIAGALPVLVFVAVNPYLWPSPVVRTAAVVRSWQTSKAAQAHDAILAPMYVSSRLEAVALTARALVRPDAVDARNFGSASPGLAFGLAVLLVAGLFSVPRLPLAWFALFGSAVLLTVGWLPFDWGRYYLPVLIWLMPVGSAGAQTIGGVVLSGVRPPVRQRGC